MANQENMLEVIQEKRRKIKTIFLNMINGEKLKLMVERTYPTIQENCFFSKSNLLKYLYDARIEYQKQEQVYKFDISEFYTENSIK